MSTRSESKTQNYAGGVHDRVVVLAPSPRDRSLLNGSLCESFNCHFVQSMDEMCSAAHTGAAALVLATEALDLQDLSELSATLKQQPSWSHLPVIVLTHDGFSQEDINALVESFDSISPTLLERPVHARTLTTALRAALHARRRQYEIRDQLAEREKHNDALLQLSQSLEKRLRERTLRLETLSQRLRLLAAKLTDSEQRERRRLAQLIHDHLQQSLVGAKIRVSLASGSANPALKDQLRGAIDMIDDGLRVARSLTAELRPPVLYEVGLAGALRWLANQFLDQHGLHVRLTLDESTNEMAERPRALLFDSIRELLMNVVRHAAVTEAAVTVTRDEHEMHVTVEDRGQGFDVSVIDLSASLGGRFGLFGVRERIRALGGQFTILSSIGHGTCVDLFLPTEAVDASPEAAPRRIPTPRENQPEHSEGESDKRVLRVLLVDDHQIVREGIASILEAEPAISVIAQAGDGEEAVLLARRLHPDVIVMDVNMPRMNGIEATRQIASEHPRMPIIGLSVQDETGTADAMLRAGASAYLFKGGEPEDLVRCVMNSVLDTNESKAV